MRNKTKARKRHLLQKKNKAEREESRRDPIISTPKRDDAVVQTASRKYFDSIFDSVPDSLDFKRITESARRVVKAFHSSNPLYPNPSGILLDSWADVYVDGDCLSAPEPVRTDLQKKVDKTVLRAIEEGKVPPHFYGL